VIQAGSLCVLQLLAGRRLALLDALDGLGIVLGAEHRRAGNQRIGARLDDL